MALYCNTTTHHYQDGGDNDTNCCGGGQGDKQTSFKYSQVIFCVAVAVSYKIQNSTQNDIYDLKIAER